MSANRVLTGKPSIDRPWMQYYPDSVRSMTVPRCTLNQYLKDRCPGEDETAIHYYGRDISWKKLFEQVDLVARALKSAGLKEGDQLPVFLRAVPEFVYLLLAAEKIGVSLLCRDNTLDENVEAVNNAHAKMIIVQDFFSAEEAEAYLTRTEVTRIVMVPALQSGRPENVPDYVMNSLQALYPARRASGVAIVNWCDFLIQGLGYHYPVEVAADVNRPLFRAYTSGSTGPSKQVIHSAYTMIAVLHQTNFFGGAPGVRPTWLLTILPPALVAVTVSIILLPLSSNKLLILDPFCDVQDLDLEIMRYRPNCWPLIPVFIETIMRNGRIPDDYDLSHLVAAGAGCEAYNNNQLKRAQQFLYDHNCNVRFTTGYGQSEAGSTVTMPMAPAPMGDGNVGVPLPLSVMSVFKPGTTEELGYNQVGELCITGPGLMLGYDNPTATASALQMHPDGRVWLHMGDEGYMDPDGVIYQLTRGDTHRYGGGALELLPMENLVADANIEGIDDEFFVLVPDEEHQGCHVPYLYVVLKEGYTVDSIREQVLACLQPHMYPVEIIPLPERPFFHFKTNRIGLAREITENRAKNQKAHSTEEHRPVWSDRRGSRKVRIGRAAKHAI